MANGKTKYELGLKNLNVEIRDGLVPIAESSIRVDKNPIEQATSILAEKYGSEVYVALVPIGAKRIRAQIEFIMRPKFLIKK